MFRSVQKRMLRQRYLFTLDTGEAFAGVLLKRDRKTFLLVQAEAIQEDGSGVPLDTELVLFRSRVLYAQKVATG